jgi:N-acetylglucosaminyldiphosphoundecaprenol N-acetyl-beta-D-mannosaminyltransferase
MHRQVAILGAFIDRVTLNEAVQRVQEFAASGTSHQIITVNVDFVRLAQVNTEFRAVINRSDLAIADGMPLVWASGWLGDRLPERVTGVELVDRCCSLAAREGYRIFLLGGEDGVAQGAAEVLRSRHEGIQIVGAYSPPVGPFSEEEDRKMVDMIREAKPHMLFVAFGAPKQDLWIARHQEEIGVPVAIGVGGVFNFLTGRVSRAPLWMQERGLEWLFRVMCEPRRLWRRYFVQDLPVVAQLALDAMRVRRAVIFEGPISPRSPQPQLSEVPATTIPSLATVQSDSFSDTGTPAGIR